MSERWWVSDTHFFHKRICEMAGRPFDSVEEMNEAIIENWNARIAKNDLVYHLGDFSFGNRTQTDELIGRLQGQIHLIRGNHDEVLDKFCDRFASFQYYKEIRIDGRKIVMCHYPIESWHGAHRGAFMLHGHSHGGLKHVMGNRLDVGVDNFGRTAVGYAPVNYEEVQAAISYLPEWEPVDHHDADEIAAMNAP